MKLYIVRHGETVENKKRIVQGQTPGRLTRLGKQQAGLLAELLEVVNFDAIYSSDLPRAVATARKIKRFQECKVQYTKDLRERTYGIFDGKKTEELLHFFKLYTQKNPHVTPFNIPIKGGETLERAQKRMVRFIDKLYAKHTKDTVLIITHGGVMRLLLAHLEKIPDIHFFKRVPGFNNCSLSIIEFDENKNHTIKLLNHTKHLSVINKAQSIGRLRKKA